jgi:hypothetical protein
LVVFTAQASTLLPPALAGLPDIPMLTPGLPALAVPPEPGLPPAAPSRGVALGEQQRSAKHVRRTLALDERPPSTRVGAETDAREAAQSAPEMLMLVHQTMRCRSAKGEARKEPDETRPMRDLFHTRANAGRCQPSFRASGKKQLRPGDTVAARKESASNA